MKRTGTTVTGVVPYIDKAGKQRLKRVHKLPAGQRKNLHGKAATQAKAWKGKSK